MYRCPTQGEERIAVAQQLQVVKSADPFAFFGSLGADQDHVNPRFQGVGPQPQIVGTDLDDVADQLIAQHQERTNVA
jgi:hypothetical protein